MRSVIGMVGAVGAVVFAAGCAGDDPACTGVGFEYGLIVSAEAGGALPDGIYEVAILADGSDLSFDLPVVDGELCPPTSSRRCESVAPHIDGGEMTARAEPLVVSGEVRGLVLRLQVTDHDRSTGPTQASVQLELDGVTLGSGMFDPDYQQVEPDGSGCDFAVRATGELPLTIP